MTDFGQAFAEGLEAANQAKRARQEVGAVFSELNSQLSAVSDGKLLIQVKSLAKSKPETPFQKLNRISSIWNTLNDPEPPKEYYEAIVATNQAISKSAQHELAKWTQARCGYPCTIAYGPVSVSCEDREALEVALMDLLRDPLIAERLSALLETQESNDEPQHPS